MRALAAKLLFACALLSLAACQQPERVPTPTQVTVHITSTDQALLSAFTQLDVRASLRTGPTSWRAPVTNSFPAASLRFPVDVPVFPRNPSEANEQFEVVAQALKDDVILAEARAITSFRRDVHLRLELRLFRCPGHESEPGYVCSPDCQGSECTVCGTSGACEPVSILDPNELPQVPGDEPSLDAATSPSGAVEGGLDARASPEGDAAAPGPGGDAATTDAASLDAGQSAPTSECDDTRPCTPGYTCEQGSCVTACLQTRCDPNATCSLVAAAPTCTCNTDHISVPAAGGGVSCVRDVACEQLGCHTDASCEVGTDQLRHCVCKFGHTGNGTSCTPVRCPTLTITDGTVTGATTYGSRVTHSCSPGYELNGGATRTCEGNQQWTGTAPTCDPVDCGPAPAPTRGMVSTTNGTRYQAVARYTCNGGSTLSGNGMRTCQANKQWSGSLPSCLSCGDGVVSPSIGEECDPTAPLSSLWTCNPTTCKVSKLYTACLTAAECDSGQTCFNYCTLSCSRSDQCPATPTGAVPVAACGAETGGFAVCLPKDCRTNSDCAPGLVCHDGGSFRYCVGCSNSVPCPGLQTCEFEPGRNWGRCR